MIYIVSSNFEIVFSENLYKIEYTQNPYGPIW
jgi:hypothetical protein